MIRFPYRSFALRSVRPGSSGSVHRPYVPIIIAGPAGLDDLSGLVDTGSDDTLFPDLFLELLGVEPRPGEDVTISGLGGGRVIVRYAVVDLEIPGAGGGYRWSSRVGFHPGPHIVLGLEGFLEFFTATFNGRSRHLTLTPNGKAPGPIHGPS